MDCYTKLILTVIAAALVLIGFQLTLNNISPAQAASPPSTETKAVPQNKVCTWSYLGDSGSPELGEAGKVKMDDDWTTMSKGGWRLVAVKAGTTDDHYVFERCQ